MEILRSIDALARIEKPVVLAAGVFDGMHLGHQAVLQAAHETAARIEGIAVALTFDPHPAAVLRPSNAPRLLTSTEFKLRLMERFGIQHALVLPFNSTLASIEAEDFILQICRATPELAGICIGEGWMFGHARRGDSRLLRTLGMRNGFFTNEVAPICLDGDVVSSTLIREALAAGRLDKVSRLLGRHHAIPGTVLHGEGVGRKLGFPTANLATNEEQFPPDGVYIVRVDAAGASHHGVANIGFRPTLSGARGRVLEAHLFDFDGDLYGARIEVAFLHFLRSEIKFESAAALRTQIARDVATARVWFGDPPTVP